MKDVFADELMKQSLQALKDEAEGALRRFAQTPAGKVVQKTGTLILKARKEGRDLTEKEIRELAEQIPIILKGSP